jgi:hypothetical protein
MDKIMHPKDAESFKEYPAPLMKLIHSAHFTNINATLPFFSPMFYFLCRALLCEKILEIGTAEGVSSFYFANAKKDNAIRNGYHDAMFYGIDIVKTDYVRENLNMFGLPNTLTNMDSIDLTPETFKDIKFDLIFQDGNHDEQHILHEFKTLWPQLKGNGKGYWLAHDCYGPGEKGFRKLMGSFGKDIEYIRVDDGIYGLAILRKMEGYVEHDHWNE